MLHLTETQKNNPLWNHKSESNRQPPLPSGMKIICIIFNSHTNNSRTLTWKSNDPLLQWKTKLPFLPTFQINTTIAPFFYFWAWNISPKTNIKRPPQRSSYPIHTFISTSFTVIQSNNHMKIVQPNKCAPTARSNNIRRIDEMKMKKMIERKG